MGKRMVWFIVFAVLASTLACAQPAGQLSSTKVPITGINSAGGGSGGSAALDGTPSPTTHPTPTPGPTASLTPSPTPTPELTTSPHGPYVVKQIETLGGETISGIVCDLTKPFQVAVVSPKVPFTFVFAPGGPGKGQWLYAYNIPSAGESHDEKGSYAISGPDRDGVLHLSMTGSDHVVFKGFDGAIPARYKFDLVPTGDPACTATH